MKNNHFAKELVKDYAFKFFREGVYRASMAADEITDPNFMSERFDDFVANNCSAAFSEFENDINADVADVTNKICEWDRKTRVINEE